MTEPITLFVCGDVMTGRGIDQALPHRCSPRLYEPYVKDARDYVRLAEDRNGTLPLPLTCDYVWGDALRELERMRPDLRLINLETSITTSDAAWTGKGIHYRMHPDNVPCLTAAGIDCCALANNHVLDWGLDGLRETLTTLDRAGIKFAGAGNGSEAASAPAVLEVPGKGRVLVFAFGSEDSGILSTWAAKSGQRPGVNLIPDYSKATARQIGERVSEHRKPGDVVVASVHWGSNWGYRVPLEHQVFAHLLIDTAGVDVVHGHSSHHPRAIEIYRNRPILYGCGDFLNDYEGIRGHEQFRGDLALMYFLCIDPASGTLQELRMTPMQIHRFSERYASEQDTQWLCGLLSREGKRFGTDTEVEPDATLRLRWRQRTSNTASTSHATP